MSFRISEPLLIQLRAHRDQRRRRRSERSRAEGAFADRSPNFIESLRRMFAGGVSVETAADDYTRNMHAWEDEIEAAHDAFLLYPGMGPMLYLTADGRVLEDARGWDGDAVVELTGEQAYAALVTGARTTGIADLLNLIPPMPSGGRICPKCNGTRRAAPVPGAPLELPCEACGSRGWVTGDL